MKQHSFISQSINSMKALLALSALLITSPSFAQNSAADHIHNEKSATYDYETGQGLITLQSYVDGEIVEKGFTKASDVVLVLDVSNSMCPYNSGTNSNETVGERVYLFGGDQIGYLHKGTSDTDNNTTTHNYQTKITIGGKETLRYTIQRGGTGTLYNLAYISGKWQYSSGTSTGKGSTWTTYTPDASDKIYTDVKLDILENACRNLIEVIYDNPFVGTGTGHRISIVTWADNNDGTASIHYINRGLTETTAANKSALIGDVTFLDTGPNTYAKRGLDKAYTNLGSSSSDREKIVLFFTDGEPNNKFADIVKSAKELKDAGAKVFSVALVADDTATASKWNGENTMQIKTYLEYVSSLYPSATGMIKSNKSIITPGTKNNDNVEYYHWSRTGSDLANVFKSIGGMAFTGGAGAEDLDSGDDVFLKDKINMANCVLVNTNGTDIKTYTAACNGKDETTGSLTFDDPVEVDSLTVTVIATENSQSIDVVGFDYSYNWCGYDAKNSKYRGKKLIVTIPFKMKAPGNGTFNEAETNLDGSSLYKGDDPVDGAAFPIPKILFTEVTIEKYGLKAGESALYIVKKSGNEIARIVLTGNSSGTMVSTKLRLVEPLDPDEYSVEETGWGYTYTNLPQKKEGYVFTFTSSKKEGTNNTSESQKVNDFK